jgi:PH domain
MIDLSQCTTVKSADLKSYKRNSFEISTPDTTFLLYADTEKEKDDWIGNVGKSIVRSSSTYRRQDGTSQNHTQQSIGDQNFQNAEDDDDLYSDDGNGYFND